MNFVKAICPHCGKELQVPEDAEQIVCMFCAKPIDIAALFLKEPEQHKTGENYESLMEQAESLLRDDLFNAKDNIHKLNQSNYEKLFRTYEEVFRPSLQTYSLAATESDQAAEHFAHVLMDRFIQKLEKDGVKRENDYRLFDCRYLIIAYTVPAILEYHTTAADELADRFLETWNEHYPKNKLGKSTFEQINSGFRKKFCFITTAVCSSLGKDDNCAELNTFRAFRDGWLAGTPEGQSKINEYYLFAPMIVRAIDRSNNKNDVYREIWESSLAPCLEKIKSGEYEACAEQYEQMVHSLEQQWLN